MAYQVHCIRGHAWELTGCWGSEHAVFEAAAEAEEACRGLAREYPDCGWGYQDDDGCRTVVVASEDCSARCRHAAGGSVLSASESTGILRRI